MTEKIIDWEVIKSINKAVYIHKFCLRTNTSLFAKIRKKQSSVTEIHHFIENFTSSPFKKWAILYLFNIRHNPTKIVNLLSVCDTIVKLQQQMRKQTIFVVDLRFFMVKQPDIDKNKPQNCL